MKLAIGTNDPATTPADLLVVGVTDAGKVAGSLSPSHARALEKLAAAARFEAKEGKSLAALTPRGFRQPRVLFVGLGQRRDAAESARRLAAMALKKAGDHGARSVAVAVPGATPELTLAAAEGAHLADYSFDRYKTGSKPGKPAPAKKGEGDKVITLTLVTSKAGAEGVKKRLARVATVALGVKAARNLGNEPSNVLTPARMAEVAQDLAARRGKDGVRCKVLGMKEIRALGMGAFLAVNQGSTLEARFIHLSYEPKARKGGRRVAVVGKGLTFDSGGISIKPASGMEEMKFDMCGAAAVLGLFECLPELDLPHAVDGYIAATDNMPSGSAIKPGDIVVSMSGRTIEVVNTDAEGRLTLVDAITYALRKDPEFVVDLATLTGACAVALGSATGIMSNDDALRDALWKSSDATGERAWPLPLFADYRPQIRSEFADVKNVGERYGGALTAGLFIQEWLPPGLPWAHMDIAGSAWTLSELPTCPKGATGIGVRTLAHWLTNLT